VQTRGTLHSLFGASAGLEDIRSRQRQDRPCVREIHPDVVVLDIIVSEVSGTEAAQNIRPACIRSPKIVLISSHYTPEESAMLADLFGDGNFIPKFEAGKALVPIMKMECVGRNHSAMPVRTK
jgi:chemotaxis response regulator CheB